MKILFAEEIDANLLDLVHLSNSFRILPREKGTPNQVPCSMRLCSCMCMILSRRAVLASQFSLDDKLKCTMELQEITVEPSGLRVVLKGTLKESHHLLPLIELSSAFLFRGVRPAPIPSSSGRRLLRGEVSAWVRCTDSR